MAEFQNQGSGIKPEQIIEIIIRRKWYIVISLCLFLTAGFIYTLNAPQTYMASTTILIQPQKVPTDYIQSLVTMDIGQRINTISQHILSRTNLEKIISEFDLYKDAENLFQEDKISDMRRRIIVKQNSRSRRSGTETFSVSFKGGEPKLVMNVANKLATFFIDENLKNREIQAVGTSEFLESELEKIKGKLEAREKQLATYRAKYMGGLPDELETNLRTLDRLQVQHTDALNALREQQNNISLLKAQITKMKQGVPIVNADGSLEPFPVGTLIEQQYQAAQRQRDELLLKYTEKHPEVMKLTKSVANLKEKVDEERDQATGETPKKADTKAGSNNALVQQEFNLKHLENERENTKKTIAQIEKAMAFYQGRVEETPKREQELQSIQRDYNNIRESYNSLLARRLEAELAVNMERKQKGEQFRIIDYARIPEKPISPDIRKLFMFSVAGALGIAGGIIFLLEFLNPVIRSEDQIETGMGIPVLASIPPLGRPGDVVKSRVEWAAFGVVSVYALMMLLLFAFLNMNGINKTFNIITTYINL